MEFRQLQQARMPGLSREQAAELFDLWLLHELSRLMAARDKTLSAILSSIDEAARWAQPSLSRARGAVLHNPGNPAVMAEHQPHVIAARRQRER